jgi:hypothetical protein
MESIKMSGASCLDETTAEVSGYEKGSSRCRLIIVEESSMQPRKWLLSTLTLSTAMGLGIAAIHARVCSRGGCHNSSIATGK